MTVKKKEYAVIKGTKVSFISNKRAIKLMGNLRNAGYANQIKYYKVQTIQINLH
jgi:hypothetical protein